MTTTLAPMPAYLIEHAFDDATRRRKNIWSAILLIGSIVLLFARLGYYELWDDEAITAMTARAVWQTGDTSIRVDGHNLLAYRNGLLSRDLKDRYTPPLQFYLLAPVVGLLGESSFVCRLPFATAGLLAILILLRWLRRYQPSNLLWAAAVVLLLGNAEFFLFCRNCRYYGLAMLFTTAAAYLYCRRDDRQRHVAGLSLALALLLATQYLNYAAAVGCLVVDYVLWGRKRRPFSWQSWLILLVPQLVVGGFVCSIWNPLAAHAAAYDSHNWFYTRGLLLWWNYRDGVACDMVVLPLLLVAPLVWFKVRSPWLLRGPLALLVYIAVVAVAVPTSLAKADGAEVRYLAPVIPLGIAAAVVAVAGLEKMDRLFRNTALGVTAGLMLIDPAPAGARPAYGSTAIQYVFELIHPQQESYTPAIDWINANVAPGDSIYVEPAFKNYPLMFRAPGPIYAWQLTDPPAAQFAEQPDIHFKNRVAPDFMIAFGTSGDALGVPDAIKWYANQNVRYQLVATLPFHWKDFYRPERFWRSFRTLQPGPGEEIYIYRHETNP